MAMRLPGIGSTYLWTMVDAKGDYFDGAKTYKVSGPWKDPKVEVIGREPARRKDEAGKPPQPSP